MKKLLVLFAIGAAFTASAQVHDELGIVVGGNVRMPFQPKYATMEKPGIGFNAGITNNLQLGKHVSVYVSAMYQQQRAVRKDFYWYDIIGPYPEKSITVDHEVAVPVMFRYSFGDGKVQPFVNAGGQFGFQFNTKTTWQYAGGDRSTYENKDLVSSLSALFGAGAKFNISERLSLSAEFRQSLWLLSNTNGYKTSIKDEYETWSTSSYLMAGVAYKFGK